MQDGKILLPYVIEYIIEFSHTALPVDEIN
jgi:hypothetical protein